MSSINKFTITSPYNYNDMSSNPIHVPNLNNPELSWHCYINPPVPNSVLNPAGQSPSLKGHLPPISFKEFV
ncbi:MAG TPA: hypothetical protein VLE95_03925, partial [Chlamydiales bacterium]|nr:hypothetical protein [Chlamydiales bacterium]